MRDTKKCMNTKLFAQIRFTNFVLHSFWWNVYFSFQFQKVLLKFKNWVSEYWIESMGQFASVPLVIAVYNSKCTLGDQLALKTAVHMG